MGLAMPEIVHSSIVAMSAEERAKSANETAISLEKLKEWLEASGRGWIIMDARQFVEAQPWPWGVRAFQQCVAAYLDHRRAIKTGDTETINGVTVDKYHTDALTVPELDRAIRYLISQVSALDPTWSLNRDPA